MLSLAMNRTRRPERCAALSGEGEVEPARVVDREHGTALARHVLAFR